MQFLVFDVNGAEGGQGWPRACRMAGKPNAGGPGFVTGDPDRMTRGSKKSLHHPGWLKL